MLGPFEDIAKPYAPHAVVDCLNIFHSLQGCIMHYVLLCVEVRSYYAIMEEHSSCRSKEFGSGLRARDRLYGSSITEGGNLLRAGVMRFLRVYLIDEINDRKNSSLVAEVATRLQ